MYTQPDSELNSRRYPARCLGASAGGNAINLRNSGSLGPVFVSWHRILRLALSISSLSLPIAMPVRMVAVRMVAVRMVAVRMVAVRMVPVRVAVISDSRGSWGI